MKQTYLATTAFIFSLLTLSATCSAAEPVSNILSRVAFDQNLNAQVPLDAEFLDEHGKPIRFGDCLDGKPTVLILGYNRCPMLCSLVLNGFLESLRNMEWRVGREFNVVSLSISPKETPEVAAARKANYLAEYGKPLGDDGWHFLTGGEAAIHSVSDAVGFRFVFDPASGEYAHPSGIVVLTPDGRVARYFFGIQFPAKELHNALEKARDRKIGSPVRRLLLLCFHYDPENSRYGALVTRSLRVGGILTILGLFAGIARMVRTQRRRKGAA